MKILIAHGSGPYPAGYPELLADGLRTMGCDPVVQALPGRGSWSSGLRLKIASRRMFAEHDPDLVHVISPDPWAADAFAELGASVVHSTIDRPSTSDWVIAPSREAYLRLRRAAPSLDYRIACLPFALEPGEAAVGAGSFVLLTHDPADSDASRWAQEAAYLIPEIPLQGEGDIRQARFLVHLSSTSEAWPAGVAEALGAGRPVISSWGGAASEFVGEAVSGFLVAPGDVQGLAASVEYLWNHPGEALFMGIQARDEARENFGVQAHLKALYKLYLRAGVSRLAI
jgi:glycosyltransferase involved in cell wall biosynthesis